MYGDIKVIVNVLSYNQRCQRIAITGAITVMELILVI
jgi:hypothetical protein